MMPGRSSIYREGRHEGGGGGGAEIIIPLCKRDCGICMYRK